MSLTNCSPNSKGLYRVYSVPFRDRFFVGIAKIQDNNEVNLSDTTILDVRLFDGTILELMAGEIKFDC